MTEATEQAFGRFAADRLPARFAKFLLKRRLARGGMAEVFLATLSGAEGFEKELVVKLIRPELSADEAFVRRFVEEAKTCVRLAHPNIVSIFELGVEHAVLYMVMELVRGATLAELLAEGGPLGPEEGVYVALEVARALDHAHRRGVIHRDVTPGNVMIDEEGAVKLLDFGIAAPVQDAASSEIFGTPGHMPPEQMEGGRLSPSTDLFALGTVLVEAWTGRAPFRRADARAARTAMAEGLPRLPSADHPSLAPLDDLVRALLSPSPDARPQHADDVSKRLRAFLREGGHDLDEIARGLRSRVSRAIVGRETRGEGARGPSAPMPRTMRPTPLAEGTKTFATRGEWSPKVDTAPVVSEGTRKIEERPVVNEGTRRLEEAPEAAVVSPEKKPGIGAPIVIIAVLLAATIGAVATLAIRTPRTVPSATTGAPSPSVPPSASAPVAIPSASVSAVPSVSTTASTSAAVTLVHLSVASSPPAMVELDGRPLGKTPVNVVAAIGEHRVVLRPQGLGERFERHVTLTASAGAEVRGDFNDEPSIVIRKTAP
ncbi:MAG: serine/threonine-protein kinase [Polyangiales bacterium]